MRRDLIRTSAREYLAGLAFYSVALIIYHYNPYYKGFISQDTWIAIKFLYLAYAVLGLPLTLLRSKDVEHKPTLIIKGIYHLVRFSLPEFVRGHAIKDRAVYILPKKEKTALLFGMVEFFYIPLMLNFFFANSRALVDIFRYYVSVGFGNVGSIDWYRGALSFLFTVDTLFFCFGYLVENKVFNNIVKSVEPTALGWVVALISYPPLNTISTQYFNWYSNEYFQTNIGWIDVSLRIAVVILLVIYVWATVSLGTKCSNLTNRGIVTRGAYKYVRHPAYISKVAAWWLMAIPVLSLGAILSLITWTIIYCLRAITEERHLSQDSDYRRYKQKTKYRFIPGLI